MILLPFCFWDFDSFQISVFCSRIPHSLQFPICSVNLLKEIIFKLLLSSRIDRILDFFWTDHVRYSPCHLITLTFMSSSAWVFLIACKVILKIVAASGLLELQGGNNWKPQRQRCDDGEWSPPVNNEIAGMTSTQLAELFECKGV